MKTCKKCNTPKSAESFYSNKKYKDNFDNICKDCRKEERILRSDEIDKYNKEYYKLNKSSELERCTNYKINNLEKIRSYQKEYNKKYKKENKEILNKKNSIYVSNKRKTDPLYKLKGNIRCLIKNSLNKIGFKKSKKTEKILGCTIEEFQIYLSEKFDSHMTMDNHGIYWHIDHIIPISSAKTEEEALMLNNYKNLQPLYWLDNLQKGNKY